MSQSNDQVIEAICQSVASVNWSDEVTETFTEPDDCQPDVKSSERKQKTNDRGKTFGKSTNAKTRRNRKERAGNSRGILVRSSGSPQEGLVIHIYVPPYDKF